MDRSRWYLSTLALVGALLIVLFPPWRASAVRTTVRYATAPGVEPFTLVDTVRWTLSFAPAYARPRFPANAAWLDTQGGRTATDATREERLRVLDEFERRYHVPPVLRTSGASWRDSILSTAGIPSASSYQASFAIDGARLALRLVVLGIIAAAADRVLRRWHRDEDDLDHQNGLADV